MLAWRAWDRLYPFAIGTISSFAYWQFFSDNKLPVSFTGLFGALVSVGGILAGFLATARSVLIALSDRDIVKAIRKTNHYDTILTYFKSAVIWSFIFAMVNAAAVLVDLNKEWSPARGGAFSVWVGVSVATLLTYLRVMRVYAEIMRAERL